MRDIARRLAPLTEGLGLEQVVVSGRLLVPGGERPVDAVLRLGYEAGRGSDGPLHRAADAADAAARRLHPQADPDPPPRSRLPVRAGAAAGRQRRDVRRARPRRRPAHWCRSTGPPGRNRAAARRRRGHARPPSATRSDGAGSPGSRCSAIRPRRWARSPKPSAGGCWPPSTWPPSWACRSSGSPCRPAPRSPWTPAARTSTGWPGSCAASSSTPRPAARSTSSSPASTSAPSRTGTPRRRC